MQFNFRTFMRLLVSLAFLSFARADYYIDDQNFTSLLYSENPGGAKWGPFQEGGETLSISLANGTMMTVDASQCYNYTYTYAACTVADNCQVQIPFSGSGITIYVLQAGAQGINASLMIDGGTPTYNVLPAPPGPSFYILNVTLFSVQGIATGNHTATMTVQNWDNIFSGMMFDYALINQTVISPTVTITSLASSTTASTTPNPTTATATSPSSSNSTVNVGAVVGGVLGGLAVLGALFMVFCFYQRRRRRAPVLSADLDAEPKIEPFLLERLYRPSERYSDGPQSAIAGSLATSPVSTHAPPHTTNSVSPLREKTRTAIINPTTSQVANSNATSGSTWTGSSSAYSSERSRPRIQQEHPTLSDDQADFVHNLYVNNVPAAAIARVIERMIAGERQPVVDEYDSLPPPSYYHAPGDA